MPIKTTDTEAIKFKSITSSREINANKKTAIRFADLTKEEAKALSYLVENGSLKISDGENTLTVRNFSNIKYIKTDYVLYGDNEDYNLIDVIEEGLFKNTVVINTFAKNKSATGTKYSDKIDMSKSIYTPGGQKNLSLGRGLSLNGDKGNDTIIGTDYNDTILGGEGNDIINGGIGNDKITGGLGINTIIYSQNNFGYDAITLTKGETLKIFFTDNLENGVLKYNPAPNKKDLVITNSLGEYSNVTIKDYYSKDLGATVLINGETDLTKEALMTSVTAANYFDVSGKKLTPKYTGSVLADNIDASDLSRETNKKSAGVQVYAGAGNDVIVGSDYNDLLKGGKGDDYINGGKGSDTLCGEGGKNTFYFNKLDGKDYIFSGSGTDKIVFNDVVSLDKMKFYFGPDKKTKSDLVISYGNGDTVTVKNYFIFGKKGVIKDVNSSVKTFVVDDVEYNLAQYALGAKTSYVEGVSDDTLTGDDTTPIEEDADKEYNVIFGSDSNNNPLFGTKLNDEIYGFKGDDFIDAVEGDDIILAGEGNDTAFGGIGNDLLYGGKGNDYLDGGIGSDKIYGEDGDDSIYSGDDNDLVDSGDGNDYICGGRGDDSLYSGKGNDTLIFNDGDGNDEIYLEAGYEDELVFKSIDDIELAIDKGNILGTKQNNDLIITYNNGKSTLKIKRYFTKDNDLTGTKIADKNGNIKNIEDIIIKDDGIIRGTPGDDILVEGTEGNDTIDGLSGNDTINGYAGDDIIYGNTGNDALYGGEGSDEFVFLSGDGQDTIYDATAEDVVKFSEQSWENLKFVINGNDLVITGDDNSVTIKKFFTDKNRLDRIITLDNGELVEHSITGEARIDITITDDFDASGEFKYNISLGENGKKITNIKAADKFVDKATGFSRKSSNNNLTITIGKYSAILPNYFAGTPKDIIMGNVSTIKTLTQSYPIKVYIDTPSYIAVDGFRENIIPAEGTQNISGMEENDKITLDGTEKYTRTNNSNTLTISNGKSTINVTDFAFDKNHHFYVNNTKISTDTKINVILDSSLGSQTYTATAYKENIKSTSSKAVNVEGLSTTDNLSFTGTITYSRTNNSDVLKVSDGSTTINVTDFAFDKTHHCSVNGVLMTLANTKINVSLTNGTTYNSTEYEEIISANGQAWVNKLSSNSNYVDTLKFTGTTSYYADGNYKDSLKVTDGTSTIYVNDYFATNSTNTNFKVTDISGKVLLSNKKLTVINYTSFNASSDTFKFANVDITGTSSNDTLIGSKNNDTIKGGDGADSINGGSGNDSIKGGDGADSINGGAGNDTIYGGAGDDTIDARSGNDTLYFEGNNDHDTVYLNTNTANLNTLVFTGITDIENAIKDKKMEAEQDGDDLILWYEYNSTTNQFTSSVRIVGYYLGGLNNTKIKGNDDSTVDINVFARTDFTIYGTVLDDNGTTKPIVNGDIYYNQYGINNDLIYGKAGSDIINGNTGNDTIYGDTNPEEDESGITHSNTYNDTIFGGDGNDLIYGDYNKDYDGYVPDPDPDPVDDPTPTPDDPTPTPDDPTPTPDDPTPTPDDPTPTPDDPTSDEPLLGDLSRGEYYVEDIILSPLGSMILNLTDPFGSNTPYTYTISNLSEEDNTIYLNYLLNGRLVIKGDYLSITANSSQYDDFIVLGSNNKIYTGDFDDIVRLGYVIDSSKTSGYYYQWQSDKNEVYTGAGDDYVVYYGLDNTIDTEYGTDNTLGIGCNTSNNDITGASINREMWVQDFDETTIDGEITSFCQGNANCCMALSIIENLGLKGVFSYYVSIDSTTDYYTVNFLKSEETKTIYKTSLANFDYVYGDMDVVLTIYAINELEKEYIQENNLTDLESYDDSGIIDRDRLGSYFFGEEKFAYYNDYMDEAPLCTNENIQQIWQLYDNGLIPNMEIQFIIDSPYPQYGIQIGHAYAVKNLTDSYITLVNPWDNNDILNLQLTDFFDCSPQLVIYGLDNDYIDTLLADLQTAGAANYVAVAGNDNIVAAAEGTANTSEYNDSIEGGKGEDTIYGGYGKDTIYGDNSGDTLGGADYIEGGYDSDTIYGGYGYDTIYGDNSYDTLAGGSDYIEGGKGNDEIHSGRGNDTLVFNNGDGYDTVYLEKGYEDRLKFADIESLVNVIQDKLIKTSIIGKDLLIEYEYNSNNGSYNSSVLIKNYCDGGLEGTIIADKNDEEISIEDIIPVIIKGTDYDDKYATADEQNYKYPIIYGSDGNVDDVIYGLGGSDEIHAGGGNDLIYGDYDDPTTVSEGSQTYNDTIYGDIDNDTIWGGKGADEFVFNPNDGNDIIKDFEAEETIRINDSMANITFKINNSDLIISYGNDHSDTITIEGYANDANKTHIEDYDNTNKKINDYYKYIPITFYSLENNDSTPYTLEWRDGFVNDNKFKFSFSGMFNITNGASTVDNISNWIDTPTSTTISGGNHQDYIKGTDAGETIKAGDGDDYIEAGKGLDTIYAGEGNDTIVFNNGDGDQGNEELKYKSGYKDIIKFTGTTFKEMTFSLGSNNTKPQITYKGSSKSQNTVVLSPANSWDDYSDIIIEDSTGTRKALEQCLWETMNGSATYAKYSFSSVSYNSNDSLPITDDTTYEYVYGFAGDDTITGDNRENIIYGGSGNDSINGGDGKDTISGGSGNDSIYGDAGDDSINGGAGKDTIHGGNGKDTIHGGEGNDSIYGEADNDSIFGDDGNDSIYGGDGNDYIKGGDGNDLIYGEAGNDTIYGGEGSDTIIFNAQDGNDRIYLNSDNNTDILKFADIESIGNLTFNISSGNLVVSYGNSQIVTIIKNDKSTYFDDYTKISDMNGNTISIREAKESIGAVVAGNANNALISQAGNCTSQSTSNTSVIDEIISDTQNWLNSTNNTQDCLTNDLLNNNESSNVNELIGVTENYNNEIWTTLV